MSGVRHSRHAFAVGLVPEKREEYLRLHSAVWPQVEQTLRDCNITNYTIFLAGDTLFSYWEYVGDDMAADLARVAEDPVTQEWWTLTDPCQRRILPEREPGSLWQSLDEVWHLG